MRRVERSPALPGWPGRAIGIFLISCALAGGGVTGSEPAGAVHFHYEWPEVPEQTGGSGLSPGERLLRLTVTGALPLEGTILRTVLPEGTSLRRLQPMQGPAGGGGADPDGVAADRAGDGADPDDAGDDAAGETAGTREALDRIELGRLVAGAPVRLEFAVLVPEDRWGIAEFLLEAARPDGRAVQEAFGVPVGDLPRGVLRDGAVEFPAAVAAPERR